jgi:hypothetical protein
MRERIDKRGVTIIAAIIFIVLISILCLSLASMLGVTSRSTVDTLRSAQALAVAQGGFNWYMRYLAGISDWTTATNQSNIALGEGTFDVTIGSQSQTSITFSVTAEVPGSGGVTIQRTMTQSALQLPSAALYGIFWGRNNGNLTASGNTINADMWSAGNADFTGSTFNGTVYHPTGTTITNATEQVVSTPVPSMPVISTTPYTNLETTWNSYIPTGNVGQTSGSDITLSSNQTWTGSITSYRDITTNGYDITCNGCTISARNLYLTGDSIFQGTNPTVNLRQNFRMSNTSSLNATNFTIRLNSQFLTNYTNPSTNTIQGNGSVGSNLNSATAISLGSTSAGTRSLTIAPSGGSITFAAGSGITIQSGTSTTLNSGVNLYSNGQNNQRIYINNANTTIRGATIFGNRAITVQSGADVLDSTLFVDYPGTTTNNVLTITGSGTVVGNAATGPCTIISIGRATTSLAVTSSATAYGLLYQYDSANSGRIQLSSATVTGAIIANQLLSPVSSSTITYNQSAIPDPPPQGFSNSACVQETSWDGN